MEISFYHLTSSPLKKALPALLEKVYEGGLRVLVIADKPAIKQLDDDLWTFHPRKFLPHGTDRRELMPVFLSDDFTNDNREVLAVTNGAEYEGNQGFKKVLDMFDGNDENALNSARKRWKSYKDKGYNLRYWKQDEKGAWAEKAA